MPDDTYYLNATVNDTAGNKNYTTSYTIVLNTTSYISLNKGWNLVSLTLKNKTLGDDKNITISQGWNLIGYSSETELGVEDAFYTPDGEAMETWDLAVATGDVYGYAAYYDSASATASARKYKYTASASLGVASSDLVEGKGYWSYANTAGTLTMAGVGGSVEGETFDWEDLRFSNGTEELNITDADDEGWINQDIYARENGDWIIIRDFGSPVTGYKSSISPWEGIFIYGNLDNITLIRRG